METLIIKLFLTECTEVSESRDDLDEKKKPLLAHIFSAGSKLIIFTSTVLQPFRFRKKRMRKAKTFDKFDI